MKLIQLIVSILTLTSCATHFYPQPGEAFMCHETNSSVSGNKSTKQAPVLEINPNLYPNPS